MSDRKHPVREVPFEPPAEKRALGFEIFRLQQLLRRLPSIETEPEAPLRLDFHLVYVGLRGRGDIVVDFAPVPIGAGLVTVVARGRVHQYTPRSARADAWMLLVRPELVATGGLDPLGAAATQWTIAKPAFSARGRELRALCELLAGEYARPLDAIQPALIADLARAVLLHTERLARTAAPAAPPELAAFYTALDRDAPAVHNVDHYARASGLSRRRLGELLVAHTGKSTKQVIDDRVALEAKRLLAHTALSVKELAARFGFSEPTNFVKFFRLHAGEPPLAFRARFHHPDTGFHLARTRGRT